MEKDGEEVVEYKTYFTNWPSTAHRWLPASNFIQTDVLAKYESRRMALTIFTRLHRSEKKSAEEEAKNAGELANEVHSTTQKFIANLKKAFPDDGSYSLPGQFDIIRDTIETMESALAEGGTLALPRKEPVVFEKKLSRSTERRLLEKSEREYFGMQLELLLFSSMCICWVQIEQQHIYPKCGSDSRFSSTR